MKNKEKGMYLLMCMPIQGRLLVPFSRIKKKLSNYPNLAMVKDGTSLVYSFLEDHDKASFHVTLSRNCIIMEISSDISPLYYEIDGLLRLISIVMILGDFYIIDARNMLPYVVHFIARQNVEYCSGIIKDQKNEEDGLSGADIILSKRILELKSDICKVEAKLSFEEKRFDALVGKIVELECESKPFSMGSICMKYGLEKGLLEHYTGKSGYKKVQRNKTVFSLVKE